MKISPQTPAPVDDHPSHSDMLAFSEKLQANQKQRLKSYIEATQPELAAAYYRESQAFQHLRESVLKPILAIVADAASRDGKQIQIIQDKDEDGIFGFATPGIRLVVLHALVPAIDLAALSGQATYLGFYGCCPDHAVRVVAEVLGVQPTIQYERVVDYSALSIQGVKEILGDFMLQAGDGVTEIGTTITRDGR